MHYVVQPGDTLWRIAAVHFGDPQKWNLIAQDNPHTQANRLLVGESLFLRDSAVTVRMGTSAPPMLLTKAHAHTATASASEHSPSLIPGRAFLFVLADEINPLNQKVVRKVMVNPKLASALSFRLGTTVPVMPNPELFGLHATAPSSPVSMGRHAMGMKPSPFSSASTHVAGAPRFSGNRFWIDVGKAEAAGASFHNTQEILDDLDRIARKMKTPQDLARVEQIKELVKLDREVLVKGPVPAAAVKGATSMAITRSLQGVQIVGFVVTAVDLTNATQKSVQQNSVKPIAAEGIRQAGGWTMAWAGAKLGAAGGALVGIETGPGALITGAVGAVVGGVAGYWGFDWIADHIDSN